MATAIDDYLELSTRASNCLRALNVTTIEELLALDLTKCLKETVNFGRRTFYELEAEVFRLKNPPVYHEYDVYTLRVTAEEAQSTAVRKAMTTIGKEMIRMGYQANLTIRREQKPHYEEITITKK